MRARHPSFRTAIGTALALLTAGFATRPLIAAEPPTLTATMKAVVMQKFGGPEVLQIAEVSKPIPGPGEVLVAVHGAGVNPVDWKIREGAFGAKNAKFPMIIGYDVSGVVESVGTGVDAFKPGDEVYSYIAIAHGGGYAEYVALPAKDVAKKPAKADFIAAAGVPLAGLTAWQALFEQADLKAGQSVLIHGAAGGVGHFAVQFAKAKGAKVYATASASNRDFLTKLGADVVIDYKNEKFEDLAKEMDVILDPIGGDTLARSYDCVKKGGVLVSIVAMPDAAKCKERGISGKVFLVHPDARQLTEIAALIDEGKVKPHISETFPLSDAAKAHEKSKTGHTVGKIVLKVN